MSGPGPVAPRAARWRAEAGSRSFAELDDKAFPAFEPGSVWLAGAGPGAPGLLTLITYHGLAQADVVVHDALVSEPILALARPGAKLVHAGKRGGKPSAVQADISRTLVEEAGRGHRVLRLKGGDPFMFGRGGEEAQVLRAASIPFRIVPGVSSGLGGLAYAGIPATHRDVNQSVTFLTGHDLTGTLPTAIDWSVVGRSPVLVLYMAAKHLPSIAHKLLAAGRAPDDPLAVVANATLPSQSITLMTLEGAREPRALPTPAVIVIGAAVPLGEALAWFDAARSQGTMG